jgi:DNA gyrase inhibitor GyrI
LKEEIGLQNLLTRFLFLIENALMPHIPHLHVGIADLAPMRVAHKLCLFPATPKRPDKKIREAFRSLREWATGFGLDPDTLLHIGIPSLDGKTLVTYDCCIEFPLPMDDASDGIDLKSLAGGFYAILRIEKKPDKIAKAIRQFHGNYIPENHILVDEERPIYEFYYADTMEYCVPIIDG